jgi:hypothetical protein
VLSPVVALSPGSRRWQAARNRQRRRYPRRRPNPAPTRPGRRSRSTTPCRSRPTGCWPPRRRSPVSKRSGSTRWWTASPATSRSPLSRSSAAFSTSRYPQFDFVPFSAGAVARSPLVMVGTFTPISTRPSPDRDGRGGASIRRAGRVQPQQQAAGREAPVPARLDRADDQENGMGRDGCLRLVTPVGFGYL